MLGRKKDGNKRVHHEATQKFDLQSIHLPRRIVKWFDRRRSESCVPGGGGASSALSWGAWLSFLVLRGLWPGKEMRGIKVLCRLCRYISILPMYGAPGTTGAWK